MELINRTRQMQQISLIGGDSIDVFPGKKVTLDPKKVYKEELKRVKNIFNTFKVPGKKLEEKVLENKNLEEKKITKKKEGTK